MDKSEIEEWNEVERVIKKCRVIQERMKMRDFLNVIDVIEEEKENKRWGKVIELMHQVAQMDREKGVEKLLLELRRREKRRKIIRLRWIYGGTVAVIVLLFALTLGLNWQKAENSNVQLGMLEEIKVPTLITLDGDQILSQEMLDLQNATECYQIQQDSKDRFRDTVNHRQQVSTVIRYQQIVIPAGYTYKVQLTDGSKIILNAGSQITFPERFIDSLRIVEFSGEGYFEVEKSDKPFVVKMDETQVKVYGTCFNLFHSRELAISEAVLVEGSIAMIARNREIKIEPNQCISYFIQDSSFYRMSVDPNDYIAWLDSSFKYNKTKLSRIVFDIAQWYGVEIKVDPKLEERKFSLEFNRSSSLEWVINMLELMMNQSIKKEGGAYYIE